MARKARDMTVEAVDRAAQLAHDREAALRERPVLDRAGRPVAEGAWVRYHDPGFSEDYEARVAEVRPGWEFDPLNRSSATRDPGADRLGVRYYRGGSEVHHGCPASLAAVVAEPLRVAELELRAAEQLIAGVEQREAQLKARRRGLERDREARLEEWRALRAEEGRGDS